MSLLSIILLQKRLHWKKAITWGKSWINTPKVKSASIRTIFCLMKNPKQHLLIPKINKTPKSSLTALVSIWGKPNQSFKPYNLICSFPFYVTNLILQPNISKSISITSISRQQGLILVTQLLNLFLTKIVSLITAKKYSLWYWKAISKEKTLAG